MEPRVSKRERRLHLTYELSHRIHCSSVYPVLAPNGSTLLLYGHDSGLRLLWRGGRRLRQRASPQTARQTNGVGDSQDVIVIDDDSEEETAPQLDEEYESGEEEQHPEHSFPSIVQDVAIELGTSVLQIAVPAIAPFTATQSLQLARTHALVALTCANGNLSLLTIPLAPPNASSVSHFVSKSIHELHIASLNTLANDITIKIIPNDAAHSSSSRMRKASETHKDIEGRLLVAAGTKGLGIWSIDLISTSLSAAKELQSPILRSPVFGSKVSFHPSSKSSELLFADCSNAVRIYQPLPGGINATQSASATQQPSGKWIMSYLTPFQNQADRPILARRKTILSADWVLGGRGILVLLEDGEWGIWDLQSKAQPGKTVEDFALHGYLVSATTAEPRDGGKQKKISSKLAPMTPNTRKSKADSLFSGPAKPAGVASTGGTSVSSSTNRTGSPDESVIMWYNGVVYSIPSLQAFWQRNNKSGGLGSLYAPALTHISDVDLMNENIASISQFATSSTSTSGALGQMNAPRDLLISAEHRFVIVQSLRSGLHRAAAPAFQLAIAERPAARDQVMLDAGDLDLGAMDRMLDGMADGAGMRRVGFAN